MTDFVALPSRWRRILLTLGAVAFVVVGSWMVGAFGPSPATPRFSQETAIAIGWVAIVFFGLCAVMGFRKIFETREQVRINADGIRYANWSDSIIPWQQITNVTTWSYRGQQAAILHLRDPARFPGPGGVTGMLASASNKLTGGDVAISLTGTNRSFTDAMAAIAHYRRAS